MHKYYTIMLLVNEYKMSACEPLVCVYLDMLQPLKVLIIQNTYMDIYNLIRLLELYVKSLSKLQFVYSKRKVSIKLIYAPKRGKKKFGPEYEATDVPLHIPRI